MGMIGAEIEAGRTVKPLYLLRRKSRGEQLPFEDCRLRITANHREVWQEFLRHPGLASVFDSSVDLSKHPITRQEQTFVELVILHTGSVYYAMKDELVVKLEGLRRDVSQFLSLPIPSAIWDKIKLVQNDDFVAFVESCRNWK